MHNVHVTHTRLSHEHTHTLHAGYTHTHHTWIPTLARPSSSATSRMDGRLRAQHVNTRHTPSYTHITYCTHVTHVYTTCTHAQMYVMWKYFTHVAYMLHTCIHHMYTHIHMCEYFTNVIRVTRPPQRPSHQPDGRQGEQARTHTCYIRVTHTSHAHLNAGQPCYILVADMHTLHTSARDTYTLHTYYIHITR